jgi:ATP-dependent Clp protease, protease subunit
MMTTQGGSLPRQGGPSRPDGPGRPGGQLRPGKPVRPGEPARPGQPAQPVPGPAPATAPSPAMQPTRVWFEQGEWPGRLYERLLNQRIVMAHGFLDSESATRLSAQLLTLDAEGNGPIRLELQNLDADLPAALTVMGVLDTLRVEVTAYAAGHTSGPALGVLAAARHRRAYPNALFTMAEPKISFEGPVAAVAAHEEQVRAMLADLYERMAEATGRPADDLQQDARQSRLLSAGQAIDYGLIDGFAEARGPAGPGITGLGR